MIGLLQQVVDLQREQIELQMAHLRWATDGKVSAEDSRLGAWHPSVSQEAAVLPRQANRDIEPVKVETKEDFMTCEFDERARGEDPQPVVLGRAQVSFSSVEDDSAKRKEMTTTRESDRSLTLSQGHQFVPALTRSSLMQLTCSQGPLQRLSTFVLAAERNTITFNVQVERIFEMLPSAVKLFLFSLGLLPVDTLNHAWQRFAYRMARCIIVVSFMTRWSCNLQFAFLRYSVTGTGFPIEAVEAFCFVLVFQMWLVMMRQLDRNGAVLLLLYDVTRRGFNWGLSVKSLQRFVFTSVCWSLFMIAIILRNLAMGATPCQLAETDQTSRALLETLAKNSCMPASCVYLVATPACFHVLFGVFWSSRLFCQFHKHELMWYAHALAEILQMDDGQTELMEQLSAAESSVTARLRQASATWVKSAIFALAGISLMIVVLVTYLMSDLDKTTEDLLFAIPVGLMLLTFLFLIGTPIAGVAEVFEYDVLHALNNPLVVKNAQRHFGQQLLPHLHTLGWGFRFGQTVINLRIIVNVFAALMITIITSVSHSVLQQFKP